MLTSKWFSIHLILLLLLLLLLLLIFIYFVCLPQVRLQSVFGYKWYTVRTHHCILWSRDFLQDGSQFCLKNAEAAAQELFASFPGVVAVFSLASAGAVGCRCKIWKILLMSWFSLSLAGAHHTSSSLPVGVRGAGSLVSPKRKTVSVHCSNADLSCLLWLQNPPL